LNKRMDSGTVFERFSGAEEDGTDSSGGSQVLGFCRFPSGVSATWRIRVRRHLSSHTIGEPFCNIQNQGGLGRSRDGSHHQNQGTADVQVPGGVTIGRAHGLECSGVVPRSGSLFSSCTRVLHGRRKAFTVAARTNPLGNVILWFTTIMVWHNLLSFPFILQMCLQTSRIFHYGEASRCVV